MNKLVTYETQCLQAIQRTQVNKTLTNNNIPCAALLFSRTTGQVIDIAVNQKHTHQNLFHHCEAILLNNWFKQHNSWRLSADLGIYCLLEPCFMCFFALIEARIKLIIYAVTNPKTKTLENVRKISYPPLGQTSVIHHNSHSNEYEKMLKIFFKMIRLRNQNKIKG